MTSDRIKKLLAEQKFYENYSKIQKVKTDEDDEGECDCDVCTAERNGMIITGGLTLNSSQGKYFMVLNFMLTPFGCEFDYLSARTLEDFPAQGDKQTCDYVRELHESGNYEVVRAMHFSMPEQMAFTGYFEEYAPKGLTKHVQKKSTPKPVVVSLKGGT